MKRFTLIYGHRDAPRLVRIVYAPDQQTAGEQHDCLKQGDERMVCRPTRPGDVETPVHRAASVRQTTAAAWLGERA